MPDLSSNSRRILLDLARKSIESHLTGDRPLPPKDLPEIEMNRGCFVTLYQGKKLRGCVGTFDSKQPLVSNLIRMANAAAFQDSRFSPVTREELPQIKIHISILGELEKIDSLDAITLGIHGVYIKQGFRSGTYLPEVAVEQKWTREEFVMRCAREKAGLTPEECANAEIYRYAVEKFSE